MVRSTEVHGARVGSFGTLLGRVTDSSGVTCDPGFFGAGSERVPRRAFVRPTRHTRVVIVISDEATTTKSTTVHSSLYTYICDAWLSGRSP